MRMETIGGDTWDDTPKTIGLSSSSWPKKKDKNNKRGKKKEKECKERERPPDTSSRYLFTGTLGNC